MTNSSAKVTPVLQPPVVSPISSGYRGRLAPSPTGLLHLGHAATFWLAQERARAAGGTLLLRVEDLDRVRCRPEFARAMFEDLHWAGLTWQEGPDVGGPCAPYRQSERSAFYAQALRQLAAVGAIYRCVCSRADVRRALSAPHAGEQSDAIYPGTCRPPEPTRVTDPIIIKESNWRFRTVPDETVEFVDERAGQQRFAAGRDFGDFLVWRKDGIPAYELAVVVDDAVMRITEVVRGEDLLESTARQLLLHRALALAPPAWFHAPLVRDVTTGQRLAKRDGALSLRALRLAGRTPAELFTDC